MLAGVIEAYLTKSRQAGMNVAPEQEAVRAGVSLECDLGPGTKADRDGWAVGIGETARGRGLEFGRYQCFRYFCGTTCDRMQAVIAHGALLQTVTQRSMKPSCTHLVAIWGKKAIAGEGWSVRSSGSISPCRI
jgi:hypothetical protein